MNRIKELREDKNMTQIRLSTELEVSQETISAYENGKHFPSVENLMKLSMLFNASCDYILGLSEMRYIQANGLDNDENVFISKWRALSAEDKSLLSAYLQALLDKK